MPKYDALAPNPQGEALVKELKWVHDMIRGDLATLGTLAGKIRDGLAPFDAAATVRGLATNGPLWQMRSNCLRHCQFVESHHMGETHHWFPELRRSNPALGPVIDKLDADHVVIADHLEEVEAAAKALGHLKTAKERSRLINAIESLSRDLLAHLAFEEEQVNPTLRTWTRWPHM
ncbi:hemerythrin domain-containing protein [Streptomyces sp. GQFP]|uniref:hemerythrin domain-containing protein n=1 Tax=Streptomyces sp. GQFP TaxID=2907545 RepID=UPI001F46676F|nr:hemerythrin domain-containing protein [Streptomyces sp. GQFP]UIX31947.1 hemerythrin domain-containing protein [Streptomyces sp. GQFP]